MKKKKKEYHIFIQSYTRVCCSCITNSPSPSKPKKLACWSQMACRKMDCNSFTVARSAGRQRCVAALIQTWLVSIPPAASMKRPRRPASPAHPQDTSNRSSWVLIQRIALWRAATASSAAVGMMWRTVKRVIPNSLGATQCVHVCVSVCMRVYVWGAPARSSQNKNTGASGAAPSHQRVRPPLRRSRS